MCQILTLRQETPGDIPPDLINGCDHALAELSQQYRLAVVSDAIVTPGRLLRRLLEKHGVKKYGCPVDECRLLHLDLHCIEDVLVIWAKHVKRSCPEERAAFLAEGRQRFPGGLPLR